MPDPSIAAFKTTGPDGVTLTAEDIGRRSLDPAKRAVQDRYRSRFRLKAEGEVLSARPLLRRPDLPPNQPLTARAPTAWRRSRDGLAWSVFATGLSGGGLPQPFAGERPNVRGVVVSGPRLF